MFKTLDVIGLGANTMDQIVRGIRFATESHATLCRAGEYELSAGGGIGNTLIGVTRLGAKVGYLGKLGGDRFGMLIKEICVAEGIDLNHCEVVPSELSSCKWLLFDEQNRRAGIFFPQASLTVDEGYIQTNAYYLRNGRLLYLETAGMPINPTIMAAEMAKSEELPVVAYLNDTLAEELASTSAERATLMSFADACIVTAESARAFTDAAQPLDIVCNIQSKLGLPAVIMYDLARGCAVATEMDFFQIPAFQITPVDEMGAGAAFRAGVVFGVLKQWQMRDIALFASACSALNAMHPGARGGMQREAEVHRFLGAHMAETNQSFHGNSGQ